MGTVPGPRAGRCAVWVPTAERLCRGISVSPRPPVLLRARNRSNACSLVYLKGGHGEACGVENGRETPFLSRTDTTLPPETGRRKSPHSCPPLAYLSRRAAGRRPPLRARAPGSPTPWLLFPFDQLSALASWPVSGCPRGGAATRSPPARAGPGTSPTQRPCAVSVPRLLPSAGWQGLFCDARSTATLYAPGAPRGSQPLQLQGGPQWTEGPRPCPPAAPRDPWGRRALTA